MSFESVIVFVGTGCVGVVCGDEQDRRDVARLFVVEQNDTVELFDVVGEYVERVDTEGGDGECDIARSGSVSQRVDGNDSGIDSGSVVEFVGFVVQSVGGDDIVVSIGVLCGVDGDESVVGGESVVRDVAGELDGGDQHRCVEWEHVCL